MKIVIVGAGGFGTALALVLARNNHDVTLIERDAQKAAGWQKSHRCNRYPWMIQHKFPDTLTICTATQASDTAADFTIIATPTSGLLDVDIPICWQRNIVLVQKGITRDLQTPYRTIKQRFPNCSVILFTGAAFAPDMAAGAEIEMLITTLSTVKAEPDSQAAIAFAQLFEGTGVWIRLNSGVTAIDFMSVLNHLRTIVSFQQGLVAGNLAKHKRNYLSTLASTYQHIIRESVDIALKLGIHPDLFQPSSVAWTTWQADVDLCRSNGSRNFTAGENMGQGEDLDITEFFIDQQAGVIEAVANIPRLVEILQKRAIELPDTFPWLHVSSAVLTGAMTPDQAAQFIRDRQKIRFMRFI